MLKSNPVRVGLLVGLVALLATAWSVRTISPSLADPIQALGLVSALIRPGRYATLAPGLIHLGYLAGLGLLCSVLLLAWNSVSATGGRAFRAGLLAGAVNVILGVPGAFWGVAGVLLFLAAAPAEILVPGASAGLTFRLLRGALGSRREAGLLRARRLILLGVAGVGLVLVSAVGWAGPLVRPAEGEAPTAGASPAVPLVSVEEARGQVDYPTPVRGFKSSVHHLRVISLGGSTAVRSVRAISAL